MPSLNPLSRIINRICCPLVLSGLLLYVPRMLFLSFCVKSALYKGTDDNIPKVLSSCVPSVLFKRKTGTFCPGMLVASISISYPSAINPDAIIFAPYPPSLTSEKIKCLKCLL